MVQQVKGSLEFGIIGVNLVCVQNEKKTNKTTTPAIRPTKKENKKKTKKNILNK